MTSTEGRVDPRTEALSRIREMLAEAGYRLGSAGTADVVRTALNDLNYIRSAIAGHEEAAKRIERDSADAKRLGVILENVRGALGPDFAEIADDNVAYAVAAELTRARAEADNARAACRVNATGGDRA
jgi:hypothetical protein